MTDSSGGGEIIVAKVKPVKMEMADEPNLHGHDEGKKQYAWQSCNDQSPEKRVQLLEYNKEIGLKSFNKIVNQTSKGSATDPDFIKQLIKDQAALENDTSGNPISVVIVGASGAGKTTLINALIGGDGVLSTSNQEASTAVHTILAFNTRKPTSRKPIYKAEVVFRTKDSVKEQLVKGFEALTEWFEARAKFYSNTEATEDDDDDEMDLDELEIMEKNAMAFVEEVNLVWGNRKRQYTAEDLYKLTSTDFLKEGDPRLEYLGGIIIEQSNDRKAFAKTLAPFMSTTRFKLDDGTECQISPLVDRVKIYGPWPFLKDGIEINDLPGLGDANASRVAIAREKLRDFHIVLVVGNVQRACDDMTVSSLLKEVGVSDLDMNGKQIQCAVVLTKIDDLGVNAGSTKTPVDSAVGETLAELEHEMDLLGKKIKKSELELAGINKEVTKVNAKIKKLEKQKKKAKGDETKARAEKTAVIQKQTLTKATIKHDKAQHKAMMALQKEFLINQRNHFVVSSLRDRSLRESRHAQAATSTTSINPLEGAQDQGPRVFPVSSLAYWPHHTKDDGEVVEEPRDVVPGFPTKRHSGIPALRRYIRELAIPERENRATTTLIRLLVLLTRLATWSQEETAASPIDPAASDHTTKAMVADVTERLQILGKDFTTTYRRQLENNNAVGYWLNRPATKECFNMAKTTVQQWIRKNPKATPRKLLKDLVGAEKIHAGTQNAIIKKFGALHICRGTVRITYTWMEDIADVFKRVIKAEWKLALQVELPKIEKKARDALDGRLASTTEKCLRQWFNGFDSPDHRKYLMSNLSTFDPIAQEVIDKIKNALRKIARRALNASAEMELIVRDKWEGAWKRALAINGKGRRDKRQAYLQTFVKYENTKLFNKVIKDMHEKLHGHAIKFGVESAKIWEQAEKDYEQQLRLIMSKITKPVEGEGQDLLARDQLLKKIWPLVMKWQSDWKAPTFFIDDEEDTSIPEPVLPSDGDYAAYAVGRLAIGGGDQDVDMDADDDEDELSDSE